MNSIGLPLSTGNMHDAVAITAASESARPTAVTEASSPERND